MSFSNPVTGGQGALVRPAIKSPNYVAGSSGWTINRDGSAEFNNLTLRGTFNGTNYVINSSGAFFYDGAPAAGNLIASITPAIGTDSHGNPYARGVSVYDNTNHVFTNLNSGISLGTFTGAGFDYTEEALIFNDPDRLIIVGPTNTGAGEADTPRLQLKAGTGGSASFGPRVVISDLNQTASADLLLSGSVVKVSNDGNTQAIWQTPTYNTNWSSSTAFGGDTGLQPLQYRLDAQDNLVIEGCFTSGGTAPTNSNVFDLPAGYIPAKNQPIAVQQRTSGGVLTSGFFLVTAPGSGTPGFRLRASTGFALAANSQYLVNGSVPLGNIP